MMTRRPRSRRLLRLAVYGLLTIACQQERPGGAAPEDVPPETSAEPTVLDLGAFEPCRRCELQSTPVAAIGEPTGQGTIDNELPWVTGRPGGGYLVIDSYTRFKLFDAGGRFVRAVGRAGEGPGELSGIFNGADLARDGRIVLLDVVKRAWIQFSETGEFLAQEAQDLSPGRFMLLEGDTLAVVASMDRRPQSVGYPLHLVDIRDGSVVRHFGSEDGAWDMSEPAASRIVLGLDDEPGNLVWWGKMGRMHLEQWSVDGVHSRTVTGDLPWFPPIPTPEERVPGLPDSFMPTFAVDDADLLWMVTITPDERWSQVERRGPEGAIAAGDRDTRYDSRLDVFDLGSQRHLGFKVWDAAEIRLMKRNGQVLVSTVEYGSFQEPRMVLHEADVSLPIGR